MGKMQREKGKRWERQVAKDLRGIFGEQVRRGWQTRKGCDDPDVHGEGMPFAVECKHQLRPNLLAALEQACESITKETMDLIPVAVVKKHVTPEWIGPVVVMRYNEWLTMVAALHERGYWEVSVPVRRVPDDERGRPAGA